MNMDTGSWTHDGLTVCAAKTYRYDMPMAGSCSISFDESGTTRVYCDEDTEDYLVAIARLSDGSSSIPLSEVELRLEED